MSQEFDDKNRAPDAELRQVPENEEKVGFFRGLLRKLHGKPSAKKVANASESNPSETENIETLSEAELEAKISILRKKRDKLNQELDRLWPVLSRFEDSAPAITREMKNASERAEDAKLELKKACEKLREINPNNPILVVK